MGGFFTWRVLESGVDSTLVETAIAAHNTWDISTKYTEIGQLAVGQTRQFIFGLAVFVVLSPGTHERCHLLVPFTWPFTIRRFNSEIHMDPEHRFLQ